MESVFFSAVCFRKEFVKTSLAKQEQCWCHKVHSKDVHPKDKRSSVILYQTIIKCHILYQTIIKWQAHNVLVLCSTPWQKTNGRHTVHVLIHVLHGTPREKTNGKIQMTETQCTYACTTQYTPRRQTTDTQCVY